MDCEWGSGGTENERGKGTKFVAGIPPLKGDDFANGEIRGMFDRGYDLNTKMEKRMTKLFKFVFLMLFICATAAHTYADEPGFSHKSIPSNVDLLQNLKPDIEGLSAVYGAQDKNEALKLLCNHLKAKAAERYYLNWQNFHRRFEDYARNYPDLKKKHFDLAKEQMSTYPPETSWILPFINLHGKEVTAYELRHLARQQKSFDIALKFYYTDEDTSCLNYFVRQVADLNRAFVAGEYDDAGNGIYESYRAGRRIHNWLFCHNACLASDKYTWQDQLLVIKTLLHHGAQLLKRTKKFSYGNHHTKGLVALFEIATFLPDFRSADAWKQQALAGLTMHLQKEVNPDGFQFERSVHYHKGDIENYFRVYQLAHINNVSLPDTFKIQFRKLFEALVLLAQPNKRLPVLQDDTGSYAENNLIDDAMAIGTLVFADPVFRYFSTDDIPGDIYWLLTDDQLKLLNDLQEQRPEIGSVALDETGYYCMRNGWSKDSEYMTISAGLSRQKPDHQHGDMLGVVAYANGHEILPNYQVHYKYPDYPFLKNSWTKNVALVDSILLGQGWTPNRGGSGFGKWSNLPQPVVLDWKTDHLYDYFCGSHNAYDSLNVSYFREIIFIKDGFWIIRDHFESDKPHLFQQVWQGQYQIIDQNHVCSDFGDGSGLQIIQLNGNSFGISSSQFRNKQNLVFNQKKKDTFVYTTLLYPFSKHRKAMVKNEVVFDPWKVVRNPERELRTADGLSTDAAFIFYNPDQTVVLLDVSQLKQDNNSDNFDRCSLILQYKENSWKIIGRFADPN